MKDRQSHEKQKESHASFAYCKRASHHLQSSALTLNIDPYFFWSEYSIKNFCFMQHCWAHHHMEKWSFFFGCRWISAKKCVRTKNAVRFFHKYVTLHSAADFTSSSFEFIAWLPQWNKWQYITAKGMRCDIQMAHPSSPSVSLAPIISYIHISLERKTQPLLLRLIKNVGPFVNLFMFKCFFGSSNCNAFGVSRERRTKKYA